MKNTLQQIFVTLGVIFVILLVIITIFMVMDPYGIRPLLFGGSASIERSSVSGSAATSEADSTNTPGESTTAGFKLSSAQIDALVNLGIDPAAVPSSISAEQEACFVAALGAERVEEIKAGAVPSAFELLKAESCM